MKNMEDSESIYNIISGKVKEAGGIYSAANNKG